MWDADFSFGDIVAWIEKQGEQKPAELSNTCEFSIKTWINIVAYVLKEHNGIGNYLNDQEVKDTAEKLQKRYKFDSASEEWDRIYRKGLDAGVNKGKAIALREKNLAWSEEDERTLDGIIEEIEANKSNAPDYDIPVYDRFLSFLKSIKERVQPQPQQELSEEDENAIGMAIIALDDLYDEDSPDTTYGGYNLPFNKAAERLKSLKERVGCEVN